jgi:hypothetical protein
MTRQEKIQMAIEKGYTCDVNSGKVYGVRGNEINCKHSKNYECFTIRGNDKKSKSILKHQFIYYMATGKIVKQIDHINGNRVDNRIDNLREATNQQNSFNRTTAKGYCWNKSNSNWMAKIKLNNKTIYLGSFDTETEARNAYLKAKEIYHQI